MFILPQFFKINEKIVTLKSGTVKGPRDRDVKTPTDATI